MEELGETENIDQGAISEFSAPLNWENASEQEKDVIVDIALMECLSAGAGIAR